MDAKDLAKIEYYRRFLRPDWRRWLAPDPERGLTREQIKTQRHDFMLRDRAFETPLARRLRKEQEEREAEEQERLEAQHRAEIEREALAMKAELASLRVELVWAELRWKADCAERKRKADLAWERFMAAFKRGDFRQKANFNPDQPRDELGKWTNGANSVGDAAAADSSDGSVRADEPVRSAQYSIGTLVGQSRVFGGGSMCFYKFTFGTIMVPGPTNRSCPSWVPAAGVSHGKLIANDN